MKTVGQRIRVAFLKKALPYCILIGSVIPSLGQSNTWYVWQGSPTNGPGTNWNTAFQDIQSAIDAATAGDLVLVTDGVYSSGTRVVYGAISNRVAVDKAVTVQSVNGPGVTEIEGGANTRCAYLTNGASLSGFTLTGGNTLNSGPISDVSGGGLYCESATATVVISNCVISENSLGYGYEAYGGGAYGGTLNNCTLSDNSAALSGFGGGASYATLNNCLLGDNSASVSGGGAYECSLNNCALTHNMAIDIGGGADTSTLNNCTLSNNVSGNGGGGGVSWSTLNNCMLSGNGAAGAGDYGGGAFWSTLENCMLSGNTAEFGGGAANCGLNNCLLTGNEASEGGGTFEGSLNNCTLTGNLGSDGGGGAHQATLDNCIVYDNTSNNGDPNYDGACTLNYCCTAPLPASGTGNILGPPLFVNEAGGNYMLQSNSPCINSGNNAYVTGNTDLAGNPRIVGGTVDIGAYEYQTPTSIISYAWLQQYGFPTDGSADFQDPDNDGMNNYQEWIAGTNPTNAASVLELISAVATNNPPGVVITWQSVNTRTYSLQSSTNLGSGPVFTTIQTNISGQANTTSYTDTNATGLCPYFYRVGVYWPVP